MIPDFKSPELDTAISAAERGGAELQRLFGKRQDKRIKVENGENLGLVTEADLLSEQAIICQLRQSFPADQIVSEECKMVKTSTNARVWIVDPMDGTNNFAHDIPHFSVSIGLWCNGVPNVAVVFNPISNDWFVAVQGQGAWHNTQRLQVSAESQLDGSLIAIGFYYDRGEMMESTLTSIGELFRKNIHGVRRFGAASLDLAWVAAGRYEAFFEYRLAPWDFAAGALLVREAGGMVTNTQGKPLGLNHSSCLASNGKIHAEVLQTVSKNWPD
jgi:myo-inositol-1(or 4)-monophosphatase